MEGVLALLPPSLAGLLLSPMKGREQALAALQHRMATDRLVVVAGPPGVGKSRLVAEASRDFPGRVSWSELGGTSERWDALRVIADAVGASLEKAADLDQASRRVGAALVRMPTLLVLDEADACQEPLLADVLAWLVEAPELRVVLTAAARPAHPAAAMVEVEGLPARVAEQVLVEITLRHWPSWRPADEDQEALTELVRRLDGIPMALQLAAGRLGMLGARSLLDRMDEVLVEGDEGMGAGLAAVLATSWSLLDEVERSALAQCAAFRAACTLEALEAVIQVERPVVEVLAALRTRSLVLTRQSPTGPRLRPLAIAAHHARRKRPEDHAAARRRHAAWFGARARDLHEVRRPRDPAGAAALCRAELDELLEVARSPEPVQPADRLDAALAAWSLLDVEAPVSACLELLDRVEEELREDGATPQATALTWARATTLRHGGRGAEALRLLKDALEVEAVPSAHRCHLATMAVFLAVDQMDPVALVHAEQAEALAVDDPALLGMVRYARAVATYPGGDLEACHRLFQDACSWLAAHGIERWLGPALQSHARLLIWMDRPHDAQARLLQAEQVLRRAGHRRALAETISNLGYLQAELGDLQGGRARLEEAAGLLGWLGIDDQLSETLRYLGEVHRALGDQAEGGRQALEALRLAERTGHRPRILLALLDVAVTALETGAPERARRRLEEAAEVPLAANHFEGLRLALAGTAALLAGEVEAARALYEGAQEQDLPPLMATLATLEAGHLDLHDLRQARAGGRTEEALALEQSLHQRLAAALVGPAAPARRSLTTRQFAKRLEARLDPQERVAAWCHLCDPGARGLLAVTGTSAYRLPGGRWVDLGNRLLLHRLLTALVEAHPRPVEADGLLQAGWPDERILPTAASNRLHKALSVLRKEGLKEVLQASAEGWRLAPELAVHRVPGSVEALCQGEDDA